MSLRCSEHRKRHVDELFVLTDCVQSTANISSDFRWSVLLDPECQFHDRGYKC
jgi:hypothetical protein